MGALEIGFHSRVCLGDVHHEPSIGLKFLVVQFCPSLVQALETLMPYGLELVPLLLGGKQGHSHILLHANISS